MIKAILFDLDETIIRDEHVGQEAFRSAASLAASRVAPAVPDPERLAKTAHQTARRLWQESPYYSYCHRIGHGAVEGLWARYDKGDHPTIHALRDWAPGYRAAIWQKALAEQGITDPGLPGALADEFFHARRRYPRFPEIDELLEALRPRYLLGIVTNGVPDLQREKIAGCGVAHLFQASIVSGEIDCGKPDPGIFRHICGELGVDPAECVMVGDNPGRDVAGAIGVGMRSVWVQRDGRPGDGRYPADLECTNLLEMLPWLQGE